jgi:hypothetical protein
VRCTDHWPLRCVIFSTPMYLAYLRPKYTPQHPILKHPQPTFLSQCQRPSFTPIQTQNDIKNVNLFVVCLGIRWYWDK